MLFPFIRPKASEPVEKQEPPLKGFFSTEAFNSGSRKLTVQDALSMSVKRRPAEFNRYLPDGTVAAMDEEESDFIKPYTETDTSIPNNQVGWYASQGFIGYQMCAILAQNWLINKACSMPARDAVRRWFEITVNNGETVDPQMLYRVRALDKKYKLAKNCQEFIRMGRIFGVRHVLPIVDYGSPEATRKALERPFNLDGIPRGGYKGLSQIDPYWITPELDGEAASRPEAINFYEPTWWRVGGQRIHRSHIILFRNGEVPDILKPTYFYGGLPLPQLIAERVYAAERTANEAPILSLSKRTTVLKKDDLASAMSDQYGFEQALSAWTRYRDNYGVKIIGGDEDATQFDTSLADFDATIMTQYQLVAAIAGVPATKILGTSPKGFNATGEFEMNSYHEELESAQENDLTPLVDRHHQIAIRSEFGEDLQIEIKWNPVNALNAKELAEINEINARTGGSLVASGAIDGVDERKRIIADKQSGYTGISDFVDGMTDQNEIPSD